MFTVLILSQSAYLYSLLELLDLLFCEVQLFLEAGNLAALDLQLLPGALLQDQDPVVQVLEYGPDA